MNYELTNNELQMKLITSELWMDYEVVDGNPCEWTRFIIDHVMWWHPWQQPKHEGVKRCEKKGRWLGAVNAKLEPTITNALELTHMCKVWRITQLHIIQV